DVGGAVNHVGKAFAGGLVGSRKQGAVGHVAAIAGTDCRPILGTGSGVDDGAADADIVRMLYRGRGTGAGITRTIADQIARRAVEDLDRQSFDGGFLRGVIIVARVEALRVIE